MKNLIGWRNTNKYVFIIVFLVIAFLCTIISVFAISVITTNFSAISEIRCTLTSTSSASACTISFPDSTQIYVSPGSPGINEYVYLGHFDLSSLPITTTIYSAVFKMISYGDVNLNGHSYASVFRVNKTWNNDTDSISFFFPSSEVYAENEFRIPYTGYGWESANITSLVKSWVNGTYTNYGFIIWDNDGVGGGTSYYAKYYSSFYGTTTSRPYLAITYLANEIPSIKGNVTFPSSVYADTDFYFNMTAIDLDNTTVIGYVNFYINGTGTGITYNASMTNNTNTQIGVLRETNFSKGSSLISEYWVSDGIAISSKYNTTVSTVINSPITVTTQNTFSNWSSGHTFNVSAGITDVDGGGDITRTNISVSSGTCLHLLNLSSGNTFNVTYNCIGNGYASANVIIGFNDSSGLYNSTALSTNAYPNHAPTTPLISAPENLSIKTVDDITINWTASTDSDSDSVTYYIFFSNDTAPIFNGTTTNLYKSFTDLPSGYAYYWYIVAGDDWDNSTLSGKGQFNIDTTVPSATFVYPTPENNHREINNSIYVNATVTHATANIDTCTLLWNTTHNYTMSKVGTGTSISCYYNISTVDGTLYQYEVIANNTDGLLGRSGIRNNLENTAPTLTANPSSNDTLVYTNDIIKCTDGTFSDSDTDTQSSAEYRWYSNETLNSTNQNLNLSLDGLMKGTVLKCSERSYDGYEWSAWYNSTEVTIINSQPVLSLSYPENLTSIITRSQFVNWTSSDFDNDVILNYFYGNSTRNSTIILFYNGTANNYTWESLDDGNYSYYINSTDDENMTVSGMNYLFIGIAPEIFNLSLSVTSGYTDTAISIYASCNDTGSNVSNAYVQIHDPNDLYANYSLTSLGGGAYYKPYYTPSIVGTYNFSFFCIDYYRNPALNLTTNISFVASTRPTESSSTTGGGVLLTITDIKENCSIEISPTDIYFVNEKVKKVTIKNNENFSISPIFELNSDYFEVTGAGSNIIYGGTVGEIAIQRIYDGNNTVESVLIVKSEVCNDVFINIKYSGGKNLPLSFSNLYSSIIKGLISKYTIFGIGVYYFFIVILSAVIIYFLLSYSDSSVATKIIATIFLVLLVNIFIFNVIPPEEKGTEVPEIALESQSSIVKSTLGQSLFTNNPSIYNIKLWVFGLSIFLVFLGVLSAIGKFSLLINSLVSSVVSLLLVLLIGYAILKLGWLV